MHLITQDVHDGLVYFIIPLNGILCYLIEYYWAQVISQNNISNIKNINSCTFFTPTTKCDIYMQNMYVDRIMQSITFHEKRNQLSLTRNDNFCSSVARRNLQQNLFWDSKKPDLMPNDIRLKLVSATAVSLRATLRYTPLWLRA